MRYLSANYLFPLHISPIKEGVLQISDEGEIVNIFRNRSEVLQYKLEIFEGILCPGFVNAHCHLELSHLLGIAEKGRGFLDFLEAIQQRNSSTEIEKQNAIEKAEQEMIANGIVAVGDICNTTDTLLQKQKGNLLYYNFIETFGIHENKIDIIFTQSMELRNEFRTAGQKATISPHAPYSVPPSLMKKIIESFDDRDELLSIHMQETKEENQLFENKEGYFFDWLNGMSADVSIWESRKKLIDVLKELKNKKILLVHNTFTKKKEITENYYCTCPKANLYIENAMPDYSIFDTDKLCVGTDSLASNNSLSILEELKIIQENSHFDLNTLLKIASKNGAEALGFESLGTFENGKKPGVNLIINFSDNKITNLI
ncbi:MAG: amidohydrolase family protein [Flavobacteriales bacterium]|jgi:cytosine/adenosine deaminase-related metal-dependent hydrolase|nr:amidohydrolase family protein [Flavobacteriales bacterium]MBT6013653.1 amidohydrolase family protein [Flavobacteriales bacterium]MBT7480789.1 amidohydrolase family protein [Flavobacteriales bacterium]